MKDFLGNASITDLVLMAGTVFTCCLLGIPRLVSWWQSRGSSQGTTLKSLVSGLSGSADDDVRPSSAAALRTLSDQIDSLSDENRKQFQPSLLALTPLAVLKAPSAVPLPEKKQAAETG